MIDRIPKHDLHFVMGDINAKVDATSKEWNEQQGSLEEGCINPNPGDLDTVFCLTVFS